MNEAIYIAIISSTAAVCIIITGFILLQVRNQRRLLKKQAELSAATIAHQKDLLQAVIQSQEAERQRIGNDLHDEVGAVLSSLRMLIEKNVTPSAGNKDDFSFQSRSMIDGVIRNVREISHQLSPHITGQFGFYDSLYQLCDNVNAAGQLNVSLELDEATLPFHLPADTCMAIYRIMAELLNNTIKHAKATAAVIRFVNNGHTLAIRYTDNGIGLPAGTAGNSKGMGLQNMESRLNMINAAWEIDSQENNGFGFTMSIPLKNTG